MPSGEKTSSWPWSAHTCSMEQLLQREMELFKSRTKKSLAELRRLAYRLPLGVASAYQAQPPYPLVYERAKGQFAWDLDGHRYLDLHAGFGANVFGHGHEAIVEAVSKQAARGSHYAHPTRSLGVYAELICQRFSMDQMRMCNSGSEATMEALRLARVFTGRSKIVRIEGAYHGHHDLVLMSMKPDPEVVGELPRPLVQPATGGLSQAIAAEVIPLAFNDHQTLQQVLSEEPIAAVIMEPIMCNLGFIEPNEGYLAKVREACTKNGTVLIWDQVKTGATVAWGGAGEIWPDCLPDLHCLGKTVGGGLPVGVYGGRREIMDLISKGQADGYGTFNGNALTVAAGTAAMELLTPEVYHQLSALGEELKLQLQEIIDLHSLPAYTAGRGAKLGMFWAPQMPEDYRQYLSSIDDNLAMLCWLYLANRGVLGAPGSDEQWTLCLPLSDISELEPLLGCLRQLAAELDTASW